MCPFPSILVHWFPKCWCLVLPSLAWPRPIQFSLIHASNIPGSHTKLFFTILDFFSPPDTSTTEWRFCFIPASSFLVELFLCSLPVPFWTPTDLGGSSSGVISFCLFIVFMGFSRQEYWCDLHSLLEWTTFCQALTSRDMSFSCSM